MKNVRIIAVMIFLSLFVVVNAQAASPWYAGLKVGLVDIDEEAGFNVDDATNLGLLIGYDITKNIAVEFEYSTTVADGDFTFGPFSGDWNVDTIGLYGVYRTEGEFFFKGKAGFVDADGEFETTSGNLSFGDTEFSFGIGGGWKMYDAGSLELEYTFVDGTDAAVLSLGYNYHF